jgi:hypothetical protein
MSLRPVHLAALAAVLLPLAGAAPCPAGMMAPSTPEYAADALTELQQGRLAEARSDLTICAADHREPAAAREHAREALDALGRDNLAGAKLHASGGAAVEHFTWALRALRKGRLTGPEGAGAHLREAKGIPKVRAQARAALRALHRRHLAAARKHIEAGLRLANSE